MKTRTLIGLILAAIACVAAWIAVRERAPVAPEAARAPLFAPEEIPLEAVDRIELVRPGAPPMRFERDAQGWWQRAPFAHPADAASMRLVIDTAAALERSRAVDPGTIDATARAALGLDPPKATVTLAWPGGERVIELGRRTIAGRAWARVQGRTEAVSVDAALHALAVEGDPRQWRAMRLYDAAGAGDVARIEMRDGRNPPGPLVVERREGRWRVTAPFQARADAEAVRGYLEALARAEADAFAADQPSDLAAFGLAKPELGVTLMRPAATGQAPERAAEIVVGAPVAEGASERFAQIDGRPAVVQLGVKAIAALFPPRAFFIDPRGCDAVPADVRRIAFVPFSPLNPRDEASFVLERTLEGWTLRAGAMDPVPADAETARRLLAQLCEARAPAVSFVALPDELRLGEFRLYGTDPQPLATVRVAHEPQGQWALGDEGGVLRVFPPNFGVRTEAADYAGGTR